MIRLTPTLHGDDNRAYQLCIAEPNDEGQPTEGMPDGHVIAVRTPSGDPTLANAGATTTDRNMTERT